MNKTFSLSWSDKYIWYPFSFVFLLTLFGFPFYAFVVFLFEPFPENMGPLVLLTVISSVLGWSLFSFCRKWVYKIVVTDTDVILYRPLLKLEIPINKIVSINRKKFSTGRGFKIYSAVLELKYNKNKSIMLGDIKGLDELTKLMKSFSQIQVGKNTKIPESINDLVHMQKELKDEKK